MPRTPNPEFDPSNPRYRGVVKRLLADKGFGFIREDRTGVEYFFHRSSIADFNSVKEGTAVQFRLGASDRGPRAEEVELA